MAFRDTWHRTLVYFGLAEDRDTYDEEPVDYREPEEELESRYRERPNVRRLSTRAAGATTSTTSSPTSRRPSGARRRCGPSLRRAPTAAAATCACTS